MLENIGEGEMKLEQVQIKYLKETPTNARIHSKEQIDMLVDSMKAFGFTAPVLATKDNVIMAGHARVKAAKRAGIKKVPVIRFDFDEITARAYTIADNKHAENADVDLPKLKDELEYLDTFNIPMTAIGYTQNDLEDLMTQIHQPEEEKAEQEIKCPECGAVFTR